MLITARMNNSIVVLSIVLIVGLLAGGIFIMGRITSAGLQLSYTPGSLFYFVFPNFSTMAIEASLVYRVVIFFVSILILSLLSIIYLMHREIISTIKWASETYRESRMFFQAAARSGQPKGPMPDLMRS